MDKNETAPAPEADTNQLERNLRVKPDVYMAALLDEVNEHLLELVDKMDTLNKNLPQAKYPASNLPSTKSIPFNSGEVTIANATPQPSDPSGYPSVQDIYAIYNHPLPEMAIVNDGPGTLYFVLMDGYIKTSAQEEVLNVGDRRPLFNVYKVFARTDTPLTQYRLVEGTLLVSSTAKTYKINTEIRPTLANNEKEKGFAASFDNSPALIPIVPPLPALYLGPSFHAPLAAGATQQLVDIETGLNMPYRIPQGYILEAFLMLAALTTAFTIRGYYELPSGSGFYNLAFTIPGPARMPPEYILNLNILSTQIVDPNGAPAGGRGIIITITNDDAAAATMIGEVDFLMILRKLS